MLYFEIRILSQGYNLFIKINFPTVLIIGMVDIGA